MSDNPLRSELSQLERKLVLLISDHQKMREELKVLKNENIELREQINRKAEEISGFQKQDKISKIVNGMVVNSNHSAADLSHMLNEYIIEVDKCIAQLSE
ncbi:hypothetical protein N7E81_08900 [Reichenbachiella carrageenanivorans]|uniref:Uncharacterized protein n=1 Tax=Reichenbachiella carrageenanivorans TaxID=2979869 RepID=A0ABY6D4Y0_9BACT|nr:hypothetical protein [Reichenbachiella carrageenanivorans]UXX81212.1 hypothetical protein N7E81_08900 [Reichenbachiella carrageenanivorans]